MLSSLPPWVLVACAVGAAGVAIWVLFKVLKWALWLLLIALLAGCLWMLFR